MPAAQSILIISRKSQNRNALDRAIRKFGLRTAHCETLTVAKKLLASQPFSAVFCDENFADGDYRDVLQQVAHLCQRVPVIVVSDCGSWEECIAAMAEGAFDYLGLPFEVHAFENVLRLVLDVAGTSEEYLAHMAT